MKKKIILGSSLAALSLAAALSLTSCGGMNTKDVDFVKSDVLDTTLVSKETKSNFYKTFETYYGDTLAGGYVIKESENKISNYATGKSITFDNLANYDTDYDSFNVAGNYYVYLLFLYENSNSTSQKVYVYNNNLNKVAEFTRRNSGYVDGNGSGTLNADKKYDVTYTYNYYDADSVQHTENIYLTLDPETGFVTTGKKIEKDPKSYQYTTLTKNVYYQSTPNKENNTYTFFDSSYNEICELETNIGFSFKLEFKEKVYLQGYRLVAEDYKNAICIYSSQNARYYYYELKTYCLDINNKKVKEIDPEVIYGLDCKGNEESDYFVANYYKIENNFADINTSYTGFFKDGELEYKLPTTITDVETDVTKIGDDYLIQVSKYSNLYNKDMEVIKDVKGLNKFNIYSDEKNFKTNFYKANGELLYSTENNVETYNISSTGLAFETKDNDIYKLLVFSDSDIKTITLGENDRYDYYSNLIITNNQNGSYTVKQPGGTASLTLYGSGNLSVDAYSAYGTVCYSVTGGFYSSATTQDASTRVSFFVGRK